MSAPPIDAVIAGSRGFALSLIAPLAQRTGVRPRFAASPAQAVGLGPSGLLVVEFQGEHSLRAIQDLVLQGGGLRIVAAVGDAHAAAVAPLQALGVEAVRWDGKTEGVLDAVARKMAAPSAAPGSRAAAPSRPPPVAPRPAAPMVARSPVASAPALERPAVTPSKPSPAGAPPRLPTAPPAVTPARPLAAVTPARVEPRAARPPAPARAPGSVTAPPPASPPGLPPGSRSGAAPFDDLLAEMRARAAQASAPAAPPASAPPFATPAASPAPNTGPGGGFGDDPFAAAAPDEFDVAVDALDAPPVSAQHAPPPDGPWPTGAPGPLDAENALRRGLAGQLDPPGTPFGCVAEVVESLTEMERSALSGEPQPVDAAPIRRAAVMRVRVAAALAAAPRPGGEVDAGAVSAFLAEIDALLSEVNALAEGAPADVQSSLEAVRNGLVKEAIDFSEAAQRASASGAVALAPAAVAPARARVGRTKVLSETEEVVPGDKRRRAIAVVLGISIAAAGAYHGWRVYAGGREIPPRPTLPVAPAGALASDPGRGGQQLLVKPDGPMSPEALRAFREQQALKGNEVEQIAPGVVVVRPATPSAEGKGGTP